MAPRGACSFMEEAIVTAFKRNLARLFLALACSMGVLGPHAHAATPQAASERSTPRQAATAQPQRAASSVSQAQTPSAAEPVIIHELHWDGARLIVGTDRPLRYRSFPLREPDRVVIDLFDAELGDPSLAQAITIETAPIQKVRIGSHPEEGFLRLVIDCDRAVPFQITQLRGASRLVIRPEGVEVPEAAPAKPEKSPEKPESKPKAPDPTVTKLASDARPRKAAAAKASEAKVADAKTADAPSVASRSVDAKKTESKTTKAAKSEEASASRGVPAKPGREGVGVQIVQSGGATQLRLQSERALSLKIQQEVDPARLIVQVPSGTLKGKLPRAKGQIEALSAREQGTDWVLEARLPSGPLDIQNRLEDDGKTLVLVIQRQSLTSAKRPLVLIDPGHGGDDPGALGAGGTKESDVNLAIALKLQAALKARGVNAVLTRTGDVTLDLASRARMIDQLGAAALISVHANSHDATSALGLETYYRTAISQPFAQHIHQVLVADLQRPDRGVREARLFVLRHPSIPSALVEAGFISNPEEERLLTDKEYQRKAAEAIAKGIATFLSTPVAELSR